jgi:hypothetical protein
VITIISEDGTVYIVPTAGSFYVPPEHQDFVAGLAPAQGDFARGARQIVYHGNPVISGLTYSSLLDYTAL